MVLLFLVRRDSNAFCITTTVVSASCDLKVALGHIVILIKILIYCSALVLSSSSVIWSVPLKVPALVPNPLRQTHIIVPS